MTAPVPPAPLPAPALDSHTHLDIMGLPIPDVLAAAQAAGISRVVTVGTDLESSRWSAPVRGRARRGIRGRRDPPERGRRGALPRGGARGDRGAGPAPRVVAVGETGLDYYRDHAAPDVQRWWFREHIKIAKRTGKALMIHDREAHADVLRILAEDGAPARVVFHCFSGDVAMVKQCAEAGYVMSFAGNVTFANAQPLRDAAAAAPPELVLVETDAPFLTP